MNMNKKSFFAMIGICSMIGLAGCHSLKQEAEVATTREESAGKQPMAQEENTQAENGQTGKHKDTMTICGPDGSITVDFYDDWDYTVCPTGSEDFSHAYGIRMSPKGKSAAIEVGYDDRFGVCGTGLVEKEHTFAGGKAKVGYYDGSKIPSYVVFQDELEGIVATVSSCDTSEGNSAADITEEEIFGILDTVVFDKKEKRLPAYMYRGGDRKMEAIIEYLHQEDGEDGETWIPCFVIFQEEAAEDGSAVKMYGNFWSFFYTIEGNSLSCMSGGEQPGVITLVADENETFGWKVKEAEFARDGSYYAKDIEKFCHGDKDLKQAYLDSCDVGHPSVKNLRMDILADYVYRNQLKMDSYKDYGWDPVYFKDGEDLIGNDEVQLISGNYILEDNKAEFPDFSLRLEKDGSFSLSESPISSYMYFGRYEIEDDCYLVLKEEAEGQVKSKNTFVIEDGVLHFVAGESDNFALVPLKDGDVLTWMRP